MLGTYGRMARSSRQMADACAVESRARARAQGTLRSKKAHSALTNLICRGV